MLQQFTLVLRNNDCDTGMGMYVESVSQSLSRGNTLTHCFMSKYHIMSYHADKVFSRCDLSKFQELCEVELWCIGQLFGTVSYVYLQKVSSKAARWTMF